MNHRFRRYVRLLFLPCVVITVAACVSRPRALPEEKPAPVRVPAVLVDPPASAETVPPVEFPLPVETPRPIEDVIRRVKDNDPALIRYFTQDEERRISIHAELDGFEVEYDLENARPSAGGETDGTANSAANSAANSEANGPRWELDFTVREAGSAEVLRDTMWWNIDDDDSGVLLSLDDDYQDQWLRYFDLFDRYGAVITFFTIGGFSPFCTEALNRGHDIGYHTRDHLNLLRVSQEIFYEQTLGEVESYREAGVPLRSFAYPFGFSEPWMREALAGTFSVQRGFGVRYCLYDREAIEAGYISSISIDNTIYKTDAEFEAAITMMLRAVKFIGRGSIVPLTTHTIADDADWGIKVHRLEYLLRTARDLRLVFYRYGDF
ncbi:MAG: polysaccharide deacetylase family protein [Treponema sp.]|jgi:peptidoglycan/xylan/chitin deacetylase (PgdA/CDA1 family)|nr:polysaccharide deacetylase family protein [Treponema sp.]